MSRPQAELVVGQAAGWGGGRRGGGRSLIVAPGGGAGSGHLCAQPVCSGCRKMPPELPPAAPSSPPGWMTFSLTFLTNTG